MRKHRSSAAEQLDAATAPSAPTSPDLAMWESPEDAETRRMRPSLLWSWVFAGIVVVVLARFVPLPLLVQNTTPTGGDVAGHVWFPSFIRQALPHLSGWSDDWYAGFPAGGLYFPLPALLTALMSFVIPYGIAMKITITLAAVLLPFSAWRLARSLAIHPLAGPAAAAATLVSQTDRFHTIYGGNLASVMAGEFSFSISFGFALLAGSLIADHLRDRSRPIARSLPFVMAACAMSHVLGGVFLVVLTTALIAAHAQRRRALVSFLPPFLISLLVAAVWWVPFIIGASYATDMKYEPTDDIKNLFPPLVNIQNTRVGHWWYIAPLAVLGVLYAAKNRCRGAFVFALTAVGFAVMYLYWPTTYVWDARWLPFFWWSVCVLAALGLLALAQDLTTRRVRLLPHIAVLAVFIPAFLHAGFVPNTPEERVTPTVASWAEWDFSGFEKKERWEEYRSILATMKKLGDSDGCGRALWEYDADQGGYGSPMAMMLLPWWTEGCVDSVEGLFMEGSQTTPFHFMTQSGASRNGSRAVRDLPYTSLDLEWAVPAMRSLGVRWYLAYNDGTIAKAKEHPDLVEKARSKHWVVFEIEDWAIVAPFSATTRVDDADHPEKFAHAFDADPTGSFTTPDAALPDVTPADLETLRISNTRSDSTGVSFTVSRVGVPVVVRQSWYPGWEVEGATGPFRAGPNMMVVVPTSQNVSMRAPAPPHRGTSELVTLLGLLVWFAWVLRTRRGARLELRSGPDSDPETSMPPVLAGLSNEERAQDATLRSSITFVSGTEPVGSHDTGITHSQHWVDDVWPDGVWPDDAQQL